MAFHCGNCEDQHTLASEGRACYEGRLYTCTEHVMSHGEDGPYTRECGAPGIETDRGYGCSSGHSHTYAAVRYQEGWDYAENRDEARQMVKAMVTPVTMDGSRLYALD